MSQMSGENDRSANVVLTADVDSYRQNIAAAAADTTTLTQRLNDLSASLDRVAKSAGTKLQIFGAGTIAGLAGATAAAAAFEHNVANLAATAAVTGRSFDAMTGSVNKLRQQFPITTSAAAELVGTVVKMQDGTASVNRLTQTFVKLGAATGESTQGLSTSMLQLQRTMGTSQKDTERYSNALTVLAQRQGVSAQGILDFSQSIAPMAKVAGMSQQAVMGVSSAFLKAGQDGYVAGNAFNKMLGDIMQSVTTGNGDLAKYANLIGVTVEQFQKMDKTKAITEVFGELNRMGPNAISLLNRMGLDGIRTVKSITAMSQQTGGIGTAVSQAMGAYADGTNKNSALNKGSQAAMGGLVNELTKLKNTFTEFGETIGAVFLPAATKIVQGINVVAKAVTGMTHALQPALSIFGALGGTAGVAVGGLLKVVGPLMSIAAAVALLRNSGTGGLLAGLGKTTGLAGITAANFANQKMNPVARLMYRTGYGLGWGTQFAVGALSGGHINIPGMMNGSAGGPGIISRIAGTVPWAIGAGARFAGFGLQSLMHPFDPQRRATFLASGATLRDSLRNTWAQWNTPQGSWGQRMIASGATMLRHPLTENPISHSSYTLSRLLRLPYNPNQPQQFGSLAGGVSPFAGFGKGLSAGIAGLASFTLGLGKATAGLGALATKTLLGGAGRGIAGVGMGALSMLGGLAKGVGGMLLNPLSLLMFGGMAYGTLKGSSKGDYTSDSSKPLIMDTYAKAVGDATTVTQDFATAMRAAVESLPKQKTRKDALTITPDEAQVALSGGYQYYDPSIAKMPNQVMKGELTYRMKDPNTTPAQLQQLALDMVHKTQDPQMVQAWMRSANRSLTPDWTSMYQGAFGQSNQWTKQNLPWWFGSDDTKSVTNALNQINKTALGLDQLAQARGGTRAQDLQRQVNFTGQLEGMAQTVFATDSHGRSVVGTREQQALNDWVNQNWFGGMGTIGTSDGVDLTRSFGRYHRHGGVKGVMGDLISQVVNTQTPDAQKAFARQMGLGVNQLQSLAQNGYYVDNNKYGNQTGVSIGLPGNAANYTFAPGQRHTLDELVSNRGPLGQQRINQIMSNWMSPEDKFKQKWGATEVGKLIQGDSIIQNALKPTNAENVNAQLAAIDELTAKMRDQGWSWEKVNKELQNFQGVVADVHDPLYGIAEGARTATKALNDFSAHFMAPGFQMQNAVSGYFGTVEANPGNDPASKQRKQDAQNEALGAAMQGIDWVHSATIQRREFKISRNQARDDYQTQVDRANDQYDLGRKRAEQSYNMMRRRSENDFQISRHRAEQQFSISRSRSERDYNITRQRATLEYNITRFRAEQEFTIAQQHSQVEFGISQERALEDYNRARSRAELSFQISMADAEADYRKQRLRAEQDFNHQVELMVKQSAQNMMNIFQRTAVQRTWSASGLLANAQDQLKRMQEQAQNLSKLKSMGVSTDVVQQLDLTNTNNAQQLARLVQDMASDPALVKQFNDNIAQRITAAGALVTNSDNAAWAEMQRQYQQQQDRTAQDFQTSIARSRRDFQLQLDQQAQDFSTQIDRSNADFARQMKWSADAQKRQLSQMTADFKRQMQNMASDHKKQTNDAVKDFNLSMKNALADHKRQLKLAGVDFKISENQMAQDHKTVMDNMLTDFNKMMTRQGNQMARSVRDMSASIKQIFTAAANQLPPALQGQLKAVEKAWNQLNKYVTAAARDTRLNILHEYGFAEGQLTSGQQKNSAANNSHKGGSQPAGAGGGGGGTVRPESLGTPALPVMASENKITTPFGAKGPHWASGMHTGQDYGYANTGDPIYSVLPGTVVFAGWNGAYGNMVKVNHGKDGKGETVETWYAHMSKILAHKGEKVGKHDLIGKVGETGNAFGAHLHLELRLDGKAVNPSMLWNGLKVTGGNYAGGVNLPDKYKFENLVGKTPVMNKMMAGNIISKTLNDTVLRWAKGMGIDLTQMPTSGGGYTGGGPLGPVNTLGNNAANQRLAQMIAGQRNWTGKEWQALLRLWTQESHFQTHATNPTSGAYGIPQSLPANKMAAAGADWYSNPATQIKWGLNYIKTRYGDPLTAWAHEQGYNWYGDGAIFKQATKIGVGERGPEAVFPLNEKGADFISSLLNRFGVDAKEANKQHVCGSSVPMTNTVYNYRIDSSSNFHGAITVQAQNPAEMATKLASAKRKAALTSPMKSR